MKRLPLIQKEYETQQDYNETRQKEMCYHEGSAIQDNCYNNYAVKNGNIFLCGRIRDGTRKEYCTQIIIRNESFFCDFSPEYCLAFNGCDEWGNMCYSIRSGMTENRDLCHNILDKNMRDSCYIGLTDEIYEFMSCCDDY